MTDQTYNATDEILSHYGITPNAGDLRFKESVRENTYYVTATRLNLREANDPDADQIALEAGLIDTLPESKKECPDDVYIWRLDTPEEGRYEADETEARAWFAESVDWYYTTTAETLEEKLQDRIREATRDEDRKVTPDEFANILVWHLAGKLYLHENVAKNLVSKFREISPILFADMWISYRPDMDSQAGAVNIYMPEGYKAAAEFIAKRDNVVDNRDNPSISRLFRTFIEREIAGE